MNETEPHTPDYDAGPRGMYDMEGWSEVDCAESDRIRGDYEARVASTLTDPAGNYSSGVVFTEWWTDDRPLLRDYRWTLDDRDCQHYAWTRVIPPAECHACRVQACEVEGNTAAPHTCGIPPAE